MSQRARYLVAAVGGIVVVLGMVGVILFSGGDTEGGVQDSAPKPSSDKRTPTTTDEASPQTPTFEPQGQDPKAAQPEDEDYNPKGDPNADAERITKSRVASCKLGKIGPLVAVNNFEGGLAKAAKESGSITSGAQTISYYLMNDRPAAAKAYNAADVANRTAAGEGIAPAPVEIRGTAVLVLSTPSSGSQDATLTRCLGPNG